MKLNLIKKEELEENSNYSFKPIEDVKLRSTEKKNSIGVSESKILVDATIPFQSFEEMQKRDEKVNIGAFHDAVFRGEGLLTYRYVNNNQNISSYIIF